MYFYHGIAASAGANIKGTKALLASSEPTCLAFTPEAGARGHRVEGALLKSQAGWETFPIPPQIPLKLNLKKSLPRRFILL